MFRRPPGVLMLSLCFLSLTEKVSGDSGKNNHERKITERDRERRRQREKVRKKLVLADQCMYYCLF